MFCIFFIKLLILVYKKSTFQPYISKMFSNEYTGFAKIINGKSASLSYFAVK